jgi:hypothetical protein
MYNFIEIENIAKENSDSLETYKKKCLETIEVVFKKISEYECKFQITFSFTNFIKEIILDFEIQSGDSVIFNNNNKIYKIPLEGDLLVEAVSKYLYDLFANEQGKLIYLNME